MSILTTLSRRSFLKVAGSCLALPYLESHGAASSGTNKKRMIFLSQGYGFVNSSFYPKSGGAFSKIGLTEGLAPLKKHQNDVTLLGNLINLGATNAHCGSATFLTGAAYSSPFNIKNSISCDQLAAEYLCKDTRYSSLTLTTLEKDSGHGETRTLAYNRKGKSVSGLTSSIELYNKLFSANESKEEVLLRIKNERSILDAMKINLRSVNRNISKLDQEKLTEYLESIREIEKGLQKQIDWSNIPKPKVNFKHPENIDGEAEVKLMFDMIVLAMQSDQTRVASYMMPSQSVLSSMGITIPVHSLSHYNQSKERETFARQRDQKCMELFGYFLDKLKATKDQDGKSIYDSTVVSYGTNIRSGHGIKGFPVFLSGGGIKSLRLGESLMLAKDTPLQNVWLTLLQEAGIPIERFSSSTGRVAELLS